MTKTKKTPAATGSLQIFHVTFTTTRNGKRVTTVLSDINQKLVDGQWVDVQPKGKDSKR
jgi:hypothetical protein